jgi:hypothetical protein
MAPFFVFIISDDGSFTAGAFFLSVADVLPTVVGDCSTASCFIYTVFK